MTAEEVRAELIAEIVKLRRAKGVSQKQLEKLSGVKQPIIARMETGENAPKITTLLKILIPLGFSLAVVEAGQK